jgi:hypothetical protein
MPDNQPLLVATFACYLATQLMPAAQLPAKYLCLLLAMQPQRKKGTLARALGHKGNSSKQHMQQQQATGDPSKGATGTREKAAVGLYAQGRPLLLLPFIA